jgi:MinD-like ATPase involved in chromosome partitioning or flagellar assembly
MKTVTFYSYKGGAGRTLLLANIAKYLARLKKRVFVLDFDLEAPGLHYKLALGGKPLQVRGGLVDVIADYTEGGQFPADLARYVLKVPVPDGPDVSLLPAGDSLSEEYWQKLFLIDWYDLFITKYVTKGEGHEVAKGVVLAEALKRAIETEYQPDYLLIDARTGITEMGGAATTLFPDVVIALLVNNIESLDGSRMLLWSVQRTRRLQRKPPVGIIPVLARLPRADEAEEARTVDRVARFLAEVPADPSDHLIGLPPPVVLHSEPDLERSEYLPLPDPAADHSLHLRLDYLNIVRHLIPAEELNV